MLNVVQTVRVGLACAAVATLLAGGACRGTNGSAASARNAGGARSLSVAAGAADPAARGKYLVAVSGCSDCHTPMKMGPTGPQPDLSRYLGGHPQEVKLPPPPADGGPWVWHGAGTNTAFAGPWGITYAINLTPHAHGMAAWTQDMFVRAMRTGKHMGESRPIQPPMPWHSVGQMTDEDLNAVFAYLKTVEPVNNVVPDYQPPAKK